MDGDVAAAEAPMARYVEGALAARRFSQRILAAFALAALLLAGGGLYALASYAIAARTREIGIRVAMGRNHARSRQWPCGKALPWRARARLWERRALGSCRGIGVAAVRDRAARPGGDRWGGRHHDRDGGGGELDAGASGGAAGSRRGVAGE